MTANALVQSALFFGVLLLLAKPLGVFMARVYSGERTVLDRIVGPLERLVYRLCGIEPGLEMTWKAYAGAFLAFNLLGFVAVYAVLRLQGVLPWNPQGLGATTPDLAFNTAVSFATNTNWQSYGGETTLSYFSQMVALTVQNFVSAAAGMAVLAAFARGVARRSAATLGNFWADLVRGTLYVLLPLCALWTLALVSQGVVQTLEPYRTVTTVESGRSQVLALGPAASQIAIKQLGTNGGGFFNANSAHPFENPTALSNFFEMLAILLLAAALCHTYGRMVGDPRQGRALLAAMSVALFAFVALGLAAEQRGNPALARLGVDARASIEQPGGNMEGKEARFGIANSVLWSAATTAASNGSVNAMHDSFTPLGGLAAMVLMQLGEVIFGGVGSGLYGLLIFALVAVFIAGLMVGRTPEYLGKKIEAFEIKMASVALLAPALCVLVGTAAAVATPAGRAGVFNPGPHGFSEVLYAFSSAGNNNGSAFAGLGANNPFYNAALGVAMLVSRYFVAIPALALAGSLVRKKAVAPGPGTFPTHTPLFVVLLLGIVVLVGALTFLPALALGPVVEHLLLYA